VQALRTIHRYWTALLFLAVIVQIGAAGYGAFNASVKTDDDKTIGEEGFEDGFDFHNGFGYLIFLATVLLLLLALGGRLGKRRVLMTLMAPILLIVQIVLAWGGESTPWVGIFHPLNAFLILGLTGRLAYEAWWGSREPATVAPSAPTP
jgi:hypothetical protein